MATRYGLKANYVFKPTAEQALRSNQSAARRRLNTALDLDRKDSSMKVLVITLLAILNPAAVAAVTEATVVSSGLCIQPKVEERYEVPQSAAGFSTIGSLVITKETDTVPLTRGIGFGFTWRAEGLPPKVVVTYRVEHPEITRPDGTQVRSYEENIEHQTQKGVLQTTDCYALGEPYELVKGDWKLTIMYKGEVIVSQTFHIVDQSQ